MYKANVVNLACRTAKKWQKINISVFCYFDLKLHLCFDSLAPGFCPSSVVNFCSCCCGCCDCCGFSFFFLSFSVSVAPSKLMIDPTCEFKPTPVTSIRPLPSITCVPDKTPISSSFFLIKSVSPVNDDSSIFKSLD